MNKIRRADILVKGEVQGVGYRDVVFKIARKLKIVGFVENTKPYDVRIIAEGEKENLDKFIEQIKIEEHPILVDEVDVTFEESTGEFEYFEVRRGDITEELGERLDLARGEMKKLHQAQKVTIEKQDQTIEILKSVKEDTSTMIEKQDTMIEKQGTTVEILRGVSGDIGVIKEEIGEIKDSLIIITGVREETKELREKYEILSKDVEEIKEILRRSTGI